MRIEHALPRFVDAQDRVDVLDPHLRGPLRRRLKREARELDERTGAMRVEALREKDDLLVVESTAEGAAEIGENGATADRQQMVDATCRSGGRSWRWVWSAIVLRVA